MIADRYQPLDAVRRGEPVRARDCATAQTVLLRETGPLPPDEFEAAMARATAARHIFCPALVTLFDVTRIDSNRLLLAYEFVQAQSLRRTSGGQPLHPRRLAEVVGDIADAVAELHARGITHGAISGDTVLITMKGKAKLDRLADPTLGQRGDEEGDVHALRRVFSEFAFGGAANLPDARSAAALAAMLRARK